MHIPEGYKLVPVEPVAYRFKEGQASWENEKPWEPTTLVHGAVLLERKALAANGTFKGDERDHYLALVVEPLYAEQPAPVAVKHTMRSIMETVERSSEYTVLTSNQCAALAAALNTTRPTHANPPTGTEPCGTHRDNDGLDEMRKPK